MANGLPCQRIPHKQVTYRRVAVPRGRGLFSIRRRGLFGRPRRPTRKPTAKLTKWPTKNPTKHPTKHPTKRPTKKPTKYIQKYKSVAVTTVTYTYPQAVNSVIPASFIRRLCQRDRYGIKTGCNELCGVCMPTARTCVASLAVFRTRWPRLAL